jgi:DNA-directed RNA polymerase specialized sigma24 family protein
LVVIRHALADHLLQSRTRRLDRLDVALSERLPGRELDPAVLYEQRALQIEVDNLLFALRARVSELSYQAFHLRWIEERTVHDIAERLSLTPKQVRDRLVRARAIFHRLAERRARDYFHPPQVDTVYTQGHNPSQ